MYLNTFGGNPVSAAVAWRFDAIENGGPFENAVTRGNHA
jgi:hypothetical protein